MRVLCFDLDDTLYPERRFVLSGFQAVGERVQELLGVEHFGGTLVTLFAQGFRGNTFNVALERLGIAYSQDLIDHLVSVYRYHRPRIHLYRDAEETLRHLHGKLPLAIITDGVLQTQRNKVTTLGIEPLFDVIVYTDAFNPPCPKPSLKPFEAIMHHFGVGGPECVYVGNDPAKDFDAPNYLGWDTVQVVRPMSVHDPVVERPFFASYKEPKTRVQSLTELARLLCSAQCSGLYQAGSRAS